jgi:hypothetical protein
VGHTERILLANSKSSNSNGFQSGDPGGTTIEFQMNKFTRSGRKAGRINLPRNLCKLNNRRSIISSEALIPIRSIILNPGVLERLL